MRVSVIIPVYNASQFLSEAVHSALDQPETVEVLLIEDGSTDDSLSVCQNLSRADDRVKLLTHPDNQNLGAGASRNLGIQQASAEYIAFLDADDLYLPARFEVTRQILADHPDADGVYETIGAQYQDVNLRDQHLNRTGAEQTGLRIKVPPDQLFRALATGRHGHFSIIGMVVAKRAFTADFLFDATLRQCQDSDLILRLARSYKLYGGRPGHAVSMRRVHGGNRVLMTKESIRFQRAYLYKCMSHNFFGSTDSYANAYIVARFVSWSWGGRLRQLGPISQPVIIAATCVYLLSHPRLLYRLLTKT